jgi:hypothetical protein
MTPQPHIPGTDDERLDLHNASVDEGAAAAGRCGMVHLPTGRVCGAPAGHASGCDFAPVP